MADMLSRLEGAECFSILIFLNNLKQALLAAPVLDHLNYDLPMEIIPDACGYNIGVVLPQRVDGQELPLAYASHPLCSSEINHMK